MSSLRRAGSVGSEPGETKGKEPVKTTLRNISVALDQLGNSLLALVPRVRRAGFGDPDETISSRLGKLADAGNPYAHWVCHVLSFLLGPDHCLHAEEPDEGETS